MHNEHRFVFNKLVYECVYRFMGTVDFRFLIYIGNLGLLFLLLLVLLRILLRRPWLAAVATVLVICPLYIPLASHPAVSWFTIGLCGLVLGVWGMIRFGLLAIVTAMFVNTLLVVMPRTLDLRAWYTDLALFALGVATALALYGFTTARGSQRAAELRAALSGSR